MVHEKSTITSFSKSVACPFGYNRISRILTPLQRLGKNPEDYPRIDGQPHVKVALRIKAKGGSAKAGDVIPYLFCLPEGETTAKAAQSDRAFHPDEFRKDNLKLGRLLV